MYLLDTNTCIYLMKNSYPVLAAKLLSLNPADVAIPSILKEIDAEMES